MPAVIPRPFDNQNALIYFQNYVKNRLSAGMNRVYLILQAIVYVILSKSGSGKCGIYIYFSQTGFDNGLDVCVSETRSQR